MGDLDSRARDSVAAIVLLARMRAHTPQDADSAVSGSPGEILDHRLATGEIDEDEYRSLRTALADARSHPEREPAMV